MTRERVYAAIFALWTPLTSPQIGGTPMPTLAQPFVTVSRQLRHVDDVDLDEMPSLFQNQLKESPWNTTMGGMVGTIIEVQMYIYAPSDQDNPTTVPSSLLNPCIDAMTALFPSPTRTNQIFIGGAACDLTLGGVEYYEGLLEKKSIATMQVFIRVPFSF